MSRALRVGAFAICAAVATSLAGWWLIPVLAARVGASASSH